MTPDQVAIVGIAAAWSAGVGLIGLAFSWLVSVTLTPIQCIDMLPAPKPGTEGRDPYGGKFFVAFRNIVVTAIRGRWLFIASMSSGIQ